MGLLDTTWRHMRRSPYQALSAVLVMTLTFFVASVLALMVLGSTRIINFFESKPQITAFFKEEAKNQDIAILENKLRDTGKVASIRFVSKDDALKIYQQQNKDDPLLLDLVTANILPSSLEVSAINVSDLSALAEVLKGDPIVDSVVFQKDIVDTLISWTNAVRIIGLAFVAVLSLVSIFTMIMVMGMKIAQRREEIEIMRLVGASFWYIRWPFIFEGALYGLIGALIAFCISYGVLIYATPFLKSFLSGIPLLPVSPIFMLSLLSVEFVIAILLGAFGSFLAVLRYLK